MKNFNFRNFNYSQISNIYERSIATLTKFDIGDVFLEDSYKEGLTLHNKNFINRYSINNSGYCIRGNIDSKDILFSSNKLDFDDIMLNIRELDLYGYKESCGIEKYENISTKNAIKTDIPNKKIEELLSRISEYLSDNSNILKDISVSFGKSHQDVLIINNLGYLIVEHRIKMRIIITVVAEKNGNENSFYEVINSLVDFSELEEKWKKHANELLKRIEVMICAKDTISGSYPILFDKGKPGILIHEAIGHSLEADLNRMKMSAFCDKFGRVIASDIVNIIDDGTANDIINFDDEGIKSQKNVLVENGVLKTYMCDRKNAKILGVNSTGNGRRQDFSHPVIPRMTNTFITANDPYNESTFEDMRNTFSKIVFVKSVSHGAVDPASGQFSFTCNEAYILDGCNETPLKECVFSGIGSEVLMNISKIGKVYELCHGTCGKRGAWVPVTDGQPEVLVNNITLG